MNFEGLKSKFKISKKMLTITFIVLALGVITSSAVVWSVSLKNQNGINMTYEQAIKEKKPFVVMFHSDWCSFCKQFMPIFIELSKDYKDKFNFVTINIDRPCYKSVVNDYAIGGIPTLYIIDPQIDNRVLIPNTILGSLDRLKVELDRYLRVRALMTLPN